MTTGINGRDNVEFAENLIKGSIAQVIFEQMFIEMDTSIVIPFGYEYTATVLHQFQRGMLKKDREELKNVRNMPDFLLVSQEKKNALLVEVRYRRNLSTAVIKEMAKEIYDRWPSTWLFLATQQGFYFGKCVEIQKDGLIKPLRADWVPEERQQKYLALIKFYIRN